MENPYNLVSGLLEEINNRRTRDVIARRFGLAGDSPQTLQEIGEQYNITRERVRQIEKNGLDHLTQPKIQLRLKPAQDEIFSYFKDYGDMRREEKTFDDLVCYCEPASPKLPAEDEARQRRQRDEPASKLAQTQKNGQELTLCRAALNLILTLGQPFERVPENDQFHPAWTINKNSVKTAKRTVDSAIKFFDKNHQLLKDTELYQVIKKSLPDISGKAALSYIDVSKLINQNNFGQFGPADWPEISPRGVRDKAYLILKKEGQPFHFSEVTDLINQQLPDARQAYMQTVHNELIKDPRFVLIGRGIYALGEWGYEPGTVVDVISQILKKEGPLSKEEILKKVLAKRLIKENTILINLQNKKSFKKLEDGRFAVV